MLIPSEIRNISRQIYVSAIGMLWTVMSVVLLLQSVLIRGLKQGSEGGINHAIFSVVLDVNTL